MQRERAQQIGDALQRLHLSSGCIINSKFLADLFQELGQGEEQHISLVDAESFVNAFFNKIELPMEKREIKHFVDRCCTDDTFSLETFSHLLTETLPRDQLTPSMCALGDQEASLSSRIQIHGKLACCIRDGFVWVLTTRDLLQSCESEIPSGAFRIKGACRIREISLSAHIAMVDWYGLLWVSKNDMFSGVERVPNLPRVRSVCAIKNILYSPPQIATLCISEDGELWNHGRFFEYTSDIRIALPGAVRKVSESFLLLEDGSLMAIGLNKYGQLGLGDTENRTSYTAIRSKFKFVEMSSGDNFSVFVGRNGNVYSCGIHSHGVLGVASKTEAIKKQITELLESNPDAAFTSRMVRVKGLCNIIRVQCNNEYTLCLDNNGKAFIFGSFGKKIKDFFGNINLPRPIPHEEEILDFMVMKGKNRNIYRDLNSIWLHKLEKNSVLLPRSNIRINPSRLRKPESVLVSATSFIEKSTKRQLTAQLINDESKEIEKLDKVLLLVDFLQERNIDEKTLLSYDILFDLFDNYKEHGKNLISQDIAPSLVFALFWMLRASITERETKNRIIDDLSLQMLCTLVKEYFPANRLSSELIFLATGSQILYPEVKFNICDLLHLSKNRYGILYCLSPKGNLSKVEFFRCPDVDYKTIQFPEEIFVQSICATKQALLCIDNKNCVWALGKFAGTSNCKRHIPQKIYDVPNITAIACGNDHALFLTSDQHVLAVGSNSCGQLGMGDPKCKSISKPYRVPQIEDAVNVFCGSNSSFVLCEKGAIWVCGNNTTGQLGIRSKDGGDYQQEFKLITRTSSVVYIKSSTTTPVASFSFYKSTAFLLNDGTVVLSGYDVASNNAVFTPQVITQLSNIQNIARGPDLFTPFYFIDDMGKVFKRNSLWGFVEVQLPPIRDILNPMEMESYCSHYEVHLDNEDNLFLQTSEKHRIRIKNAFEFLGQQDVKYTSVKSARK